MIGVIAPPTEHSVISEFFELFKTPWEFYKKDRKYDVLLCTAKENIDNNSAKLLLLYADYELPTDAESNIAIASNGEHSIFGYKGARIPIYGSFLTFKKGLSILVDEESQQPAIHQRELGKCTVTRMGYSLFGEVHRLLKTGQPAVYAHIPTLDLHIALLRDLILASGISLIEIPPVPNGYQFVACLTHDVDHPSIIQHRWDHTIFGFLYRAAFGSLGNLFRGRISIRNLITNWTAVLRLPFVHMGFANDFWADFEKRYQKLEEGLCSTFFVIPFKDYPGIGTAGPVPRFRASRYSARDIADTIREITAAGSEVALHGIDAWIDSAKGLSELEEIRRLTGIWEIGVRMHWLYYDQQSSMVLEQLGVAYDSTNGYRETVGYRAGTTQVYRPPEATQLLELPLHVMDTALFYPTYLGLSSQQATALLGQMIDNAAHSGGCLTINWHDRSLAPERLWDLCYRDVIQSLKDRGAWFATGKQATSWFQKRRAAVFETHSLEMNASSTTVSVDRNGSLPGLLLRRYKVHASPQTPESASKHYVDTPLDGAPRN